MRSGFVLLAAAVLAMAAPNVRAGDFCSTCEVQLGLGGTYLGSGDRQYGGR